MHQVRTGESGSESVLGQQSPSSSIASIGSGFPKGGPLVVPLIHQESGWAIDWDALKRTANLPEKLAGLSNEAYEVCK